jgi:hypothetical protein
VVDGFSYLVTIDQQHPEAEDDERYDQLYVWVRGPGHPYDGCRTHWLDGKRASIDDSIGSVLSEIETWAAAARREKNDQQARWQAAMDEAERLATHDRLVAEAQRWLIWAREYAEMMDPLFELQVTPMPKLQPEELEPYLDGWSPKGPDVYVPRWRGASAWL